MAAPTASFGLRTAAASAYCTPESRWRRRTRRMGEGIEAPTLSRNSGSSLER
jgi:hypothetical protein